MGVKRLPLDLLIEVELAFLHTYMRNGTEDRILIYANDAGAMLAMAPEMDRTSGSVVCDIQLSTEWGGQTWDLAFDLHSHHVMGCFWSGTDDANERIRGPVFGVCSWKEGKPDWLFRKWTGPTTGFQNLSYEEVVTLG